MGQGEKRSMCSFDADTIDDITRETRNAATEVRRAELWCGFDVQPRSNFIVGLYNCAWVWEVPRSSDYVLPDNQLVVAISSERAYK